MAQAGFGGHLFDRQGRQELRIPTGRYQCRMPRGVHRRGHLIGDAHLTFGPGHRHRIGQPLGRGLLAAEVPGRTGHRKRHQPRAQNLGPRHQVIHRGDHRLEKPRIAIDIGHRDMQLRATSLGLAAPHTPTNSQRPRGGGTRGDPIGHSHRHGPGGRKIGHRRGGHRRPIRAPNRQHPWRFTLSFRRT